MSDPVSKEPESPKKKNKIVNFLSSLGDKEADKKAEKGKKKEESEAAVKIRKPSISESDPLRKKRKSAARSQSFEPLTDLEPVVQDGQTTLSVKRVKTDVHLYKEKLSPKGKPIIVDGDEESNYRSRKRTKKLTKTHEEIAPVRENYRKRKKVKTIDSAQSKKIGSLTKQAPANRSDLDLFKLVSADDSPQLRPQSEINSARKSFKQHLRQSLNLANLTQSEYHKSPSKAKSPK